jgi:hypothetical protein
MILSLYNEGMLPLLLIFLVNTSGGAILDSTDLKFIKFGLKAMNMTLQDLEFDKDWVGPDSFRLRRISQLLRHPLQVPSFVEMSRESIKLYTDSLSKLLLFMGKETGVSVRFHPVDLEKSKHLSEIPVKDPYLLSAVEVLLSGMEISKSLLDSAFSGLTRGERDTLLREMTLLWSDEDDSTDDTLKGILPREFGFEVDTSGEVKTVEILKIAKKIGRDAILKAGLVSIAAVSEALVILKKVEGKEFFYQWDTPLGRVAVGGTGMNRYVGDYALILDLGGDDLYEGRIAGGVGLVPNGYPVSYLIDLSGDDQYLSERVISQGAGGFGIGILVDLDGDDQYRGSHISQGAGIFGIGVLLDGGGNDEFRSGFFTEGAGNFGWGILVDKGGDDSYRAVDWAQGFGSVWGFGLLHDLKGDDIYYAGGHYIHHPLLPTQYRSFAQGFGMGWRKDASGGIGYLLDGGGNDNYYVEVYGQGASYWYSLGVLLDEGGNDTYSAAEYAQGAGIHLSVGILVDIEGKDHYFSRYGPSQGEGHDLSVGWLIDRRGDDTYQVSGGQGIGLTNSVGIFIDGEGNDTYLTTEPLGQGDANWRRGFGGIGIFLDLSGKDTYIGAPGKDGEWWIQGTFGVGIDNNKEP